MLYAIQSIGYCNLYFQKMLKEVGIQQENRHSWLGLTYIAMATFVVATLLFTCLLLRMSNMLFAFAVLY